MEKIATENLFLLEFLVDNVNLDPKCDCSAAPGETCVSFQFLDNAPLNVCEADFNPLRSYKSQNDDVKSGKSCLFSLSPDQAVASTHQFDIFVTIFKKMQPGWLPDKVDVGAALISISNLFNELISSVETADGTNPTAKTLKDNFDITNPSGQVIGKIGVYIRMSCFGKLIVTQFQMNLNDKSVLFKDKEGKSLYRYKKAGKGKKDGCTAKQQQPPQQQRYNSNCPTSPCAEGVNQMPPNQFGRGNQMQPNQFGGGMQPNSNCPFSPCIMDQGNGFQESYGQQSLPPCSECGAGSNAPCFQPSNQGGMMNMGYSPPPSSGMMTPCIECGNLPFAPCMPPQTGGGGGYGQHPNTPCEECGNMPDAPCAEGGAPDEGNYQEIGASMGGNSLTIRVHKDKNKVEQVDPNATFVSESSEGCACMPGRPGKKKKQQQVLNMGPGVQQGNQNVPFSFKMGRSGDSGDNNVVVNPPVATRPDGAQFTEFSDPNKELFILRIGKKSEGVDKKQNLELELCTPKGPELKPIPKKETRDTQYDPADAGPETEGKKGKKGGKEKGGKKKK